MKARYAVFALCLGALPARADCAVGPGYDVTSTGNTVTICNSYGGYGSCDGGTLLRQDADSGTVVQLTGFCVPASDAGDQGVCYEDECVPPGSYRYGFAEPLACGCGARSLWGETTVTASFDGGCSLSSGDSAPTPYGGSLPWSGKEANGSAQCAGCGCGTSGAVFGFDGGLFALSLALLWRRRSRR